MNLGFKFFPSDMKVTELPTIPARTRIVRSVALAFLVGACTSVTAPPPRLGVDAF